MEYIIGFREELTEYLRLEKELGTLNIRYTTIGPLLGEAKSVLKFLKDRDFSVDSLLELYIDEKTVEARNIESNVVWIRQCMSEIADLIGPIGQFRHVVWSLVKEMGITLEQFAERLGCSENTFVNLCNTSESLDKDSYVKLCDYFQLDKTHRRFIRYCPVLKAELEGRTDKLTY